MKILDFLSVDRLPELNTYRTLQGLLPGSRLMFHATDSYSNLSQINTIVVSGTRYLDLRAVGTWSNLPRTTISYSFEEPTAGGAMASDSITIGFRGLTKTVTFSDATRFPNGAKGISIAYLEMLGSQSYSVQLLSMEDIVGMSTLQEHYFEVVIDANSWDIKVYRDGRLWRRDSIADQIEEGSYISSISVGVNGALGVRGYAGECSYSLRDLYIAEFYPTDIQKRLGPQRVVDLPIDLVDAPTWVADNPAQSIKDSLLDGMQQSTLSPNNTITVTDELPYGTVSFSYDHLPARSAVNGLIFSVDAVSTIAGGELVTEVLDDGQKVAESRDQFSASYNVTHPPSDTSWDRRVFIKSIQDAAPDNLSEINRHSLRISAATLLD